MYVQALMAPPEIGDDVIADFPPDNIRAELEKLLRTKRCPPAYDVLIQAHEEVSAKLSEAIASTTLEHHVMAKRKQDAWRRLLGTIEIQMEWMRRQVAVDPDEVYHLVNRWIALRVSREALARTREVEGLKVTNGILSVTAGRPHVGIDVKA